MDEEKGVRSSEFWTKNLVQAIVAVGAILGHGVDEEKAVFVVAALEGAYMALRTARKAARDLAGAVRAWRGYAPGDS